MGNNCRIPSACQDCSHLDDLRAALDWQESDKPVPDSRIENTPLGVLQSAVPGTVLTFQTDQSITLEGEAEEQVIGVISGLIRCFRISSDGRRYINRFAGPGSIIGIEFGGEYRYSTEALTDCETIVFRASAAESAFERNQCVRRAIRSAMTEELAERERAEFRLARMASDERVADFLLEISDEGETASVHLPMSRVDIADHLGITLETVSRSLHKLDRQGLISLRNAHRLDIRSGRALRRFVQRGMDDYIPQSRKTEAYPAAGRDDVLRNAS